MLLQKNQKWKKKEKYSFVRTEKVYFFYLWLIYYSFLFIIFKFNMIQKIFSHHSLCFRALCQASLMAYTRGKYESLENSE